MFAIFLGVTVEYFATHCAIIMIHFFKIFKLNCTITTHHEFPLETKISFRASNVHKIVLHLI